MVKISTLVHSHQVAKTIVAHFVYLLRSYLHPVISELTQHEDNRSNAAFKTTFRAFEARSPQKDEGKDNQNSKKTL